MNQASPRFSHKGSRSNSLDVREETLVKVPEFSQAHFDMTTTAGHMRYTVLACLVSSDRLEKKRSYRWPQRRLYVQCEV